MAIPLRGEVWTVDLGYVAKTRPAVVLSREYGDNDRAIITVVPHTTAIRGSEFEVPVDSRFLAKPGVFLVQGVTSIPSEKATRCLGKLTPEQLCGVEEKLRSWLGF